MMNYYSIIIHVNWMFECSTSGSIGLCYSKNECEKCEVNFRIRMNNNDNDKLSSQPCYDYV